MQTPIPTQKHFTTPTKIEQKLSKVHQKKNSPQLKAQFE